MELTNCPNCDALFVPTTFRDVCDACYKEEERKFETVYEYIRRRVNRQAHIAQVVEATGVEEELIIKFVKKGRIRTAQFPNLRFPCEKCGAGIKEGRLCDNCTKTLRLDLADLEKTEKRRTEIEERNKKVTYFTKGK